MSKFGRNEISKRRQEQRSAPKKIRERRHERVEVIPLRKRRFGVVIGIVAAISAAALLAAGLSEKPKNTKNKDPEAQVLPHDYESLEGPAIPENNSHSIPNFTFDKQQKVKFPAPDDLQIDQSEFEKISTAITNDTITKFQNEFIPNFAKLTGSGQLKAQEDLIRNFLFEIANLIAASDPRIEKKMKKFLETWNPKLFYQIIKEINRYLNAGGYVMKITTKGPNQNGKLEFDIDIFQITDSIFAYSSDSRGQTKTRVLKVGNGFRNDHDHYNAGYIVASNDSFEQLTIIHSGASRELARTLIGSSREPYPRFQIPVDEKELEKNILDDALHHETTHAHLINRFPGLEKALPDQFEIKIKVTMAGGEINIGGNFTPVNFHELCAIGAQLATTKTEIPFTEADILTTPTADPTPGYSIVAAIMPLAILEAVSDSPIRQEILQNYRDNLAQGNEMDPRALLRLIGSSPYGLETTHRVGEILYRVGYELLEKAEKGQLRKVERPL